MIAELTTIPLSTAYLCMDCNSVGPSAIECPDCKSRALLSLSAVLDRKPKRRNK